MTNENDECVTRSNQLWVINRTKLSIAIKVADNHICNPLLDVVIDLYSECVAGYKLNVASHSPVLTALRHAILPKDAQAQYNTHCEWGIYGIPEGIIVGEAISSDSSALDQIAHQLGCQIRRSVCPSEDGLVERLYNAVDCNLLSQLPRYHETPQERSTANQETYLDLQQLEQTIGRYIVDNYNHKPYPKAPSQTRSQRWKGGLPNQPSIPFEQIFDSLLASPPQRCVQEFGRLTFHRLLYCSEQLLTRVGEMVIVRYNPADMSTISVYQKNNGQEIFLGYASAVHMP